MTLENSINSRILCWHDEVVAERLVEDVLYIYSHVTGDVFEVQGIASDFCKMIDGQKSIGYLKSEILSSTPHAPKDQFDKDVDGLVNNLVDLSLAYLK